MYSLPHLLYIHDITRNHDLTCTYRTIIFQSTGFLYDVAPYGYNAVYLSLYGLIWPCTT